MINTYKFKILKSSWGIIVHLTADIKRAEIPKLETEFDLPYQDQEALKFGMKLLPPVHVVVKNIEYNPTDYQPEGLTCALIHLASKQLDIPVPYYTWKFDKKYIFDFNENKTSSNVERKS